jgi:hypothetical protein
MKTTVELPDALMREVKLRAVYEGRRLKDVVADLLRRGLDASVEGASANTSGALTDDEQTGLPLVLCRHRARPTHRLTPERVAEILLDQDLGR